MRIWRLILFSFILLLGLSFVLSPQQTAFGQGNRFYVAANGNNSNPGTKDRPWKTIQKAANTVIAGDTVYVRGGTYREEVTIQKSGSNSGGYIRFRNFPGETPVIDGSQFASNTSHHGFNIQDKHHIIIEGFEITGFKSSGQYNGAHGIRVGGSSSYIHLRNNHIHHIESDANTGADAHGIAVYGTSNSRSHHIYIQDNEIDHMKLGWSESVTIAGNVERFYVQRNIVHDNDNIGIDVIGGSPWIEDNHGVLPENNVARIGWVMDNKVYNIDSCDNPAYRHQDSNTIEPIAPGIYVDGGRNVVISRNQVFDSNVGVSLGSEIPGHVTENVKFHNNFVHNNHRAGLILGGAGAGNGGSRNNTIVHNTFYGNDTREYKCDNIKGSTDFHLFSELGLQSQVQNNVIKNNIFYSARNNRLINHWQSNAVGNVVDNNMYFAPTGANGTEFRWNNQGFSSFSEYQTRAGKDQHSRFINPKLMNPSAGDLHLQRNSPAINSAATLSQRGSEDYDLQSRVIGTSADIGADEYRTSDCLKTVYRYWNETIGDHFYTTSFNELRDGNSHWVRQDDMGRIAGNETCRIPNGKAIYRYWNSGIGDHFYTTSRNELGEGRNGYKDEGIIGYASPVNHPNHGTMALHRYWNPTIKDHFYTTDWNELGSGGDGYRYEGIIGYVFP